MFVDKLNSAPTDKRRPGEETETTFPFSLNSSLRSDKVTVCCPRLQFFVGWKLRVSSESLDPVIRGFSNLIIGNAK